MAKLKGDLFSDDGRTATSRLGHSEIKSRIATWHTFADVTLYADGTLEVRVTRDNQLLHEWSLDDPEG